MYGGGQERGLRPGTLPVALIAGLGTASVIAMKSAEERSQAAAAIKSELLAALVPLGAQSNGDTARTVPTTLNISIPGVDSEAAILALKDIIALSNGSACTSQNYSASHVLLAAGLSDQRIAGALRLSWGPSAGPIPVGEIAQRLAALVAR